MPAPVHGSMIAVMTFLLFLLFNAGIQVFTACPPQKPAFLDENTRYAWPTNASYYMSSSFGETRSAHFHAAMDIGTWGHEGYAVFAARDGIVQRVSVSPFGYGNVIYLLHDDGSISLYAHLKDFHPAIRQVVDSVRIQDYSADFNQNLEDRQIHFRKGQQIGWTGSTGVGPPHLHFELRTPEGRPFNPLLAGLRIEDTIPPQFSGLAIEPLSAHAKVSGSKEIHRLRPGTRQGIYHFGSVDTEGVVGLAVNVFDRANASNNIHAVYELKMYVNGEKYFHSRVDSFSYAQSRQVFLDRVYPILRSERRGYQRLYVRPANTLPFYKETGHSGKLDLPPGTHEIVIEAADYFGNRSKAMLEIRSLPVSGPAVQKKTGPLQPTRIPSFSSTGNPGTGESGESYNQHRNQPEQLVWNRDWIAPLRTDDEYAISLRTIGSFRDEQKKTLSIGDGLPLDAHLRMLLYQQEDKWILNRIIPGYPLTLYSHDMSVSVHFHEETFFEPVTIGISHDNPGFMLFPDHVPFRRPATIRVLLDEELSARQGVGLYQKNARNNRLSHVTSTRDKRGNALTGTISSNGYYTIRIDSLPPVLSSPSIGRWRHNGKHYVTVNVEDDLSGIDYRSTVFKVNGVRGIAEFDPEKSLLRYHHPDFYPLEENTVYLELSDRAGNREIRTFEAVRRN